MTTTKRRLVFLEFPEDATHLEYSGWLRGEEVQRVCLAPAPSVKLEALGLDYLFPHWFVSSAALQAELSDNWTKLDELVALINEHVPYGWMAAYYLKLLLDTCMEKTIHLAMALQTVVPGQIVFFQTKLLGYDFRLAFNENESLYAQLLPLVCAVYSPESELIPLPAPPRSQARSRPAMSSRLRGWLAPHYHALKRSFHHRQDKTLRQPSICLVEAGYGLEHVAAKLVSSYRVIRWDPPSAFSLPLGLSLGRVTISLANIGMLKEYKQICRNAWHAFKEDPRVQALLSCRRVCFFDVVASRLEYLFTKVFPHLFVLESRAAEFFRQRNVVCIASAFFSRPYTYALAQAARSNGIPVVTLQHSSYGYWDWPIAKYFDGVMSNYKLVGGEGVVSYVEEVERSGCQALPTGLIPLDNLSKKGRQAKQQDMYKPRVVYPLASYVKNFIHYSNSRLALTEYFEVNRHILKVLGRFPEIEVIVRPHPAWQFEENWVPLNNWTQQQGWQHIRFESGGSTLAAMQTANLILIDSPSTVLLHAVTTDARILVFNRIFPMTERGLATLKKRVIYSDNLDAFVGLLEDILNRQDFDNSHYQDNEFLRLYGTYKEDGHSISRATEALKYAASQRSSYKGCETSDKADGQWSSGAVQI